MDQQEEEFYFLSFFSLLPELSEMPTNIHHRLNFWTVRCRSQKMHHNGMPGIILIQRVPREPYINKLSYFYQKYKYLLFVSLTLRDPVFIGVEGEAGELFLCVCSDFSSQSSSSFFIILYFNPLQK